MPAHDNDEPAGEIDRPDSAALEALRRQTVWFLGALIAGAAALYFNYAEGWGQEFLRQARAQSVWLPPAIVAIGMLLICRIRDVVFPGTEGTGIPQAIAALKMGDVPERSRVLSARVAVGKVLLLTLGLFSGATIGREGPSVHVAACSLYLGTRWARFPRHLVERGLILAGGAAGIGAAFNTPVAAIVFTFEEIGRSFDKENVGTIVRTAVVACALSWVPLSDYLFYGRVTTRLHAPPEWIVVLAVGAVGGLLGGGFARVVLAGAALVQRASQWNPYVVAAGLGLTLAAVGVLSGGESYGGGYPQARAILIEGKEFPLWYPMAKAAGLFISLISGIPGGLFDPSLSIGAGLGGIVSPLLPGMERQAFVLLAMGAYFAGVVQSPLTAAIILVEMTSADQMILPLLAATIVAYETSRLVCPTSLYEALAEAFLRRAAPPAS